MEQHEVSIRPRHLRLMFFIEHNIAYDNLFNLIRANQKVWGGRYNPIIPVRDGVIEDGYLELMRHYDPDKIYYSKGVNPELIRNLHFNPNEITVLAMPHDYTRVSGVNTSYIVSKLDTDSKILTFSSEVNLDKSPLKSYYGINYGLSAVNLAVDYELLKTTKQLKITKDTFPEIQKSIHVGQPSNINHFSRTGATTRILRNPVDTGPLDAELVIAGSDSSNEDLFYFWNRLLFGGRDILYVTKNELEVLIQDKYFFGVLHDFSRENEVKLVSRSLNPEQISEIMTKKLQPLAFNTRFTTKNVNHFPYKILDSSEGFQDLFNQKTTIQLVIGSNGLLTLPMVHFLDNIKFNSQQWAVDVTLRSLPGNFQNELKFPFTTNTQFIIRAFEGRINKERRIVLLVDSQRDAARNIEITIPESRSLINQLLSYPVIDNTIYQTWYERIGLHDASNRLQSFLKLFSYNFAEIEDFFTDAFWVEIFEFLIISGKKVGDAIIFDDIVEKCITALNANGIDLVERDQSHFNKENLVLGLKGTLARLCECKVFLIGFKIKCHHCSSAFWYPISEINTHVTCKGCLESFNLPIESKFSYKLNDLVKNNIFTTEKDRDGNLAVIRTLAHLHSRSSSQFYYYPQINLYANSFTNDPINEIDITCISNGQFIIGEVKHDSKLFFQDGMKSLKALFEVATVTKPDVVLISCYTDTNGKLEKAAKSLAQLFKNSKHIPEIRAIKLQTPDHFNLKGSNYFYF